MLHHHHLPSGACKKVHFTSPMICRWEVERVAACIRPDSDVHLYLGVCLNRGHDECLDSPPPPRRRLRHSAI